MADATRIRNEYKKVCQAMDALDKKGGGHSPLPEDSDLYCRLSVLKNTLEWVHPILIKTKATGPDRFNELMGHRYMAFGPTFAVMYP
jgi:hypothetical protein